MDGETRLATDSDVDGVTATLTAAFATDPLWSWAFPDARDQAVWWRYCIPSAFRYPGVWISGDYAAVSVWIPPGGVELTEEEQRAAIYKTDTEGLEALYRERSMLKLSVFPEDIAEAIYFLASDMSAKSTGNIVNVDAGNAQSFTR